MEPTGVLQGERVILREPQPSDIDDKLALGRHSEIARMYGGDSEGPQPTRADAEAWYRTLQGHPYAWIIEHQDRAIGEIRLDDLDAGDQRASLAIGIGDPELLGQGLGSEAIELVLDYAFGHLGLHRIAARVLAYNHRAIKTYRNCGFIIEGREREAALVDGQRHDDLIMGVLATERPSRTPRA